MADQSAALGGGGEDVPVNGGSTGSDILCSLHVDYSLMLLAYKQAALGCCSMIHVS